MGKEILTFVDIEMKHINFTNIKVLFFRANRHRLRFII